MGSLPHRLNVVEAGFGQSAEQGAAANLHQIPETITASSLISALVLQVIAG